MKAAPSFKPGDRIAYSAKHLRSIADYSKAAADMRGTVLDVSPPVSKSGGHYFTYSRDGDPNGADPHGGLSCNFCLAARISIDAALA